MNKFKIMYSSDRTYEKLVSEIYFENDLVAQISQDKGLDSLEVKIFESPLMNLNGLLEIIDTAKQALISGKAK
jgi:hypothetical protein